MAWLAFIKEVSASWGPEVAAVVGGGAAASLMGELRVVVAGPVRQRFLLEPEALWAGEGPASEAVRKREDFRGWLEATLLCEL